MPLQRAERDTVECAFVSLELLQNALEKERTHKYKTCVQGRERVFEFEPGGLSAECNLLALGCGVRNLGLGVADEEIFSFGHSRGVNGVADGSPKRAADEDEGKRWPESVSHQGDEDVSGAVALLEEAAVRDEGDGNECQVDKGEVEPGHVVDKDDP